MRDYYNVLGIDRKASADEIKRAYRRMAHKYHPDKNPGDERAEERFKEATAAYEILSDPSKRRRYDRFGHAGVGAGDFSNFGQGFGDVFGEIFGDFFNKRQGRSSSRGRDRIHRLVIDFETAALGGERVIDVRRNPKCDPCSGTGARPGSAPQLCHACGGTGEIRVQQGLLSVSKRCTYCKARGRIITDPCESCHGTGRLERNAQLRVKIPPGADEETTLRYSGEGEPGSHGGPPGDLLVRLEITPHPIYSRTGSDIHLELPVTFAEATLGAQVEVPTLHGRVRMKIPPGSQSGRIFRLRGKGLKQLNGTGKGDQHVAIRVETPTNLSHDERALFDRLRELESTRGSAQREALWAALSNQKGDDN